MQTNNKLREALEQKSVDDADTAAWILDKSPEDVCEERMSWSELCDKAYNLAAGFVTLRNAINAVLAAPPRNCDRFNTGDLKRDAQDAMKAMLDEGVAGYRGMAEYLLSPVCTEQKGEHAWD